jgi:hypothetical protein
MCLFNMAGFPVIPSLIATYSRRMSKTPLAAGLNVGRKLGSYRGATVWSASLEISNDDGQSILITFSKRAPAWVRVLDASSKHSVRPVLDAKGRVALLVADMGSGEQPLDWLVLALKRVGDSKQRFYFGYGWLEPNVIPSITGRDKWPKKLILLGALASVLVLTLGLGALSLTGQPMRVTATLATSPKPQPTSAKQGFNQTIALAATKTCVAQQNSKSDYKSFDLGSVIRCLDHAGYEVKSSKVIAIGGIAKASIRFRDGQTSIVAVVTRHGKTWRLDS